MRARAYQVRRRSNSIAWREKRRWTFQEARKFCRTLGFEDVTRQTAADIVEDFLGWQHDHGEAATTRLERAMNAVGGMTCAGRQ